MTSLRLAARLARREVVRRPWRTLLVALVVAVPVAGMVMAATVVRTVNLDGAERFALDYGSADFVADGNASAQLGRMPPGTEMAAFRSEWLLARTTDDRRLRGVVSDVPLENPLAAGLVRVTTGRAPDAAGEMLLSPAAAKRLGVAVGDTVTFDRPGPATLTVTGLGQRRSDLSEPMIVLGDAADWP